MNAPSTRSMTRRVLPAIVILVAGIGAFLLTKLRPEPQLSAPRTAPRSVIAIPIAPTTLRAETRASGIVTSAQNVHLTARVEGELIAVDPRLEAGAFFTRGDVLARIEPRDYELALTQAHAAREQAATALTLVEAEAAVAREEWSGPTPAPPLSLKEPQLREARARLESAQASLRLAELRLEGQGAPRF